MRKIFQYILMAVALVAAASCSNELDEVLQPAGNGSLQFVVSDFPAFGESPDTRVIGTQDIGKTAWDIDDQIIVTLTSKKFGAQSAVLTYNGTSWSTAVSFLYLDNETPAVSAIYAPCYEVTEDGVMKLSDGMQLGMTEYIPAKTTVDGLNVSISFKDVTRTYSRLRLASEAGQELTVVTTGFTPAGATSEATNDYTLTTDDNGNAFLYGLFAEKATVSVSNGNVEMENYAFTNATEKCVSYALDASYPYLTFTASAAQTMTINTYDNYVLDESMQYSVNGGEWVQLTANTAITFGEDNGTLRLRGKSANGTATSESSYAQVFFGDNNVKVACSGDIRTLVDYENYATVSTANARFCSLFESCTSLTAAPELPATTLADNCYNGMFRSCTSLTAAPELPATTLTEFCYNRMFYYCTSLTVAPELPATTLAGNCYYGMFYGCTSLTSAPELPAATLVNGCYNRMFYNCTSLTVAPELPATTLAGNCYYGMFYGCTSLTSAPELPAATLVNGCYNRMFYNCTSLTVAPELPATALAEHCYSNMFNGCTSLTVAPKLPATTLAESCYESMFYNCTNLTTAPELPATTLAEYCYLQMFNGCTSLTAAPKLPATTLFANCYYEMFRGCTSLTAAPELPAATLVNWCYNSMFYGCTNLSSITMLATNIPANVGCLRNWVSGVASSGTFTKAANLIQGSETGQIPTGTSGIPEGWTVVNK